MTLLLCSDTHISRYIWKDRLDIIGDAYAALHQLIDIAEEYSAESVILAGDVFDTDNPTSEDVQCFQRFAAALWQKGIGLFYLSGQHDAANPSWPGSIHPHAVELDGKLLHFSAGKVFGISHVKKRFLPGKLQSVPEGCDLVVAHQLWQELLGSGDRFADASILEVPHARWLYSGDMHRKATAKGLRPDGRPITAVSTGATHLRRLGEPTAHYVGLWEGSKIRFVRLYSRPIAEVSIPGRAVEVSSYLDGVVEELVNLDRFESPFCDYKPIVVVRTEGASAGLVDLVDEYFGKLEGQVHYLVRFGEELRIGYGAEEEEVCRNSDSVRLTDLVVQIIQHYYEEQGIDSAEPEVSDCIQLAHAALRSENNARQVLDRLRQQYLLQD